MTRCEYTFVMHGGDMPRQCIQERGHDGPHRYVHGEYEPMSQPKPRDATLALMAGNIAAGLVSKPDPKGAGLFGDEGVAEWIKSVTMLSVGMARSILAEIKRTEERP